MTESDVILLWKVFKQIRENDKSELDPDWRDFLVAVSLLLEAELKRQERKKAQ